MLTNKIMLEVARMTIKFNCFVACCVTVYMALVASGNAQEENNSQSSGWTPFRYSAVREACFPDARIPVYGFELNLVEGENDYTGGFSLGIFNFSKHFQGLRTCFMHKAELSQGMVISGANVSETSHGFDIGGINFSREDQAGCHIAAVFNYAGKSQHGVRFAGLANVSKGGTQTGFQVAGLFNQAETFHGGQLAGFMNLQDRVNGFQISTINIIGFKYRKLIEDSGALQIGVANWVSAFPASKSVDNDDDDWVVQLGILNYTGGASGIQFGLININKNGFLPFFPIINFSL